MERNLVRQFEQRTRQFAIDAIRLSRKLSKDPSLWALLNQVVRSAGSVSANHLAISGARSTREFLAKLLIVHEEAAESAHWFSILAEVNDDHGRDEEIRRLHGEAEHLRNMFGRARTTTKRRLVG